MPVYFRVVRQYLHHQSYRQKIKSAGKYAFIHVDLLEGASNKEVVIQFLKLVTEADGIISTKASMLKAARAEGFFCIHRLFIVDSISFHNIDKQVAQSNPDCIEILRLYAQSAGLGDGENPPTADCWRAGVR